MNAYGHNVVAISLLQLLDDFRCLRTIDAPLSGEVLKQHNALRRFWLLVNQTLVLGDMVASKKRQANAIYYI